MCIYKVSIRPGLARTVPDFQLEPWVFLKAIFVLDVDLGIHIVPDIQKV